MASKQDPRSNLIAGETYLNVDFMRKERMRQKLQAIICLIRNSIKFIYVYTNKNCYANSFSGQATVRQHTMLIIT